MSLALSGRNPPHNGGRTPSSIQAFLGPRRGAAERAWLCSPSPPLLCSVSHITSRVLVLELINATVILPQRVVERLEM